MAEQARHKLPSDALGSSTAVLAGLLVLLGGCGGGNNNAMVGPPPTTYDVSQAVAGMVKSGLTASLTFSGTISGQTVTGSGTLHAAAGSSITFNNVAAVGQLQALSATIMAGGSSSPYDTNVIDYYDATSYALLGESTSSEYDVASTPISYPTSVTTGASGTLGTMSRYTDNTLSQSLGTIQLSYQVNAPAGASTLPTLSFTQQYFDTSSKLQETDVMTYSLSSSNALVLVSGSATSGADTLNFTSP